MISPNPLAADLEMIFSRTEMLWANLRDQRLFITGGTGFFGRWLLESFAWANRRLALNAAAVILTRDAAAFRLRAPHLAADPSIRLHPGNVRDFDFPEGQFSHVIHGAAELGTTVMSPDPSLLFETIAQGTQRTLEFAAQAGARQFLFVSSGAVYGEQPPELSRVPEDFFGNVNAPQSLGAYANGKRAGESLCLAFARSQGLPAKIARCFAFVGPHLPLDARYALGNFIRDGLHGGPVRVQSDGTTVRSYLYSADLTVWLWHILFRGQSGRAYNVGSDQELNLAETARLVAGCFSPALEVVIGQESAAGGKVGRYVPDIARAKLELQLSPWTSLREGILKTVASHQ